MDNCAVYNVYIRKWLENARSGRTLTSCSSLPAMVLDITYCLHTEDIIRIQHTTTSVWKFYFQT